ncbi:MAG: DUF4982 domain-containing protein [Prevotella sp.]|nr:DUF4982 domain-containing protein [Prevotella sp.]
MRCRLLMSFLCVFCVMNAQPRSEELLSEWQFSKDGISWEQVTVPHDWAISGPFDKKWDLQTVAIEQNGETAATEKSGRSGALPWIGEGQYKTTFRVPAEYERAELVFDGAMSEPVVYVNGQEAGRWAYGYNAFRIDVTPYIHAQGADNQLLVKLKNVEESSRWYPGAGLYRPVKLVFTQKTCIDEWETFVRTSKVSGDIAVMCGSMQLSGASSTQHLSAEFDVYDHRGMLVAASHDDIDGEGRAEMEIIVRNPQLWSPESPYLYKVCARVYNNNILLDEQQFRTGIRTISVSNNGGFRLNGVSRKFKGVCLHHDLGPLGAAVNKAALIRQIRMMKEMGADAIRTSHNMPSQMQMEICDSMGMMVMAESFDMWIYPKCRNGYARFFKEWSDRDIENLVKSHRNHPCIVMWSIGNEIPEQWSEEGREIARHLQNLCHELDPTRFVTQGLDHAEDALKSGFAQVMDIPGFNYRVHKYDNNIKSLPKGFLLGCETASTVSSRGVYKFPVVVSNHQVYPDGQCSSYDTEYCSWSNLPEDDFIAQDDKAYTIGQFVWTGFDYLGEPTPYDEYWPSRSSYFGICDLAGLPKDRYFLYRSQWNKDSHTIHLLPHWTWPGRRGKVTPVYCYTDAPSAELFVNGKSQGRIFKQKDEKMDRYRLRWNNVKYEPGELRVVAFDEHDRVIGEQKVNTAGAPSHILLEPDRSVLNADGDDISFVTVSMVDKDGNLCPDASDELEFSVEGCGTFQAACNGDATSLEPFTKPQMRLFHGRLVVLVRTTKQAGTMVLKVRTSKGGSESEVSLLSKGI